MPHLPTGLNNVCACAKAHGSRWRQRPGHHKNLRKKWRLKFLNSGPRTEQWPRQTPSGDLGVLSSSCLLNKLASPLTGLCMCAKKQWDGRKQNPKPGVTRTSSPKSSINLSCLRAVFTNCTSFKLCVQKSMCRAMVEDACAKLSFHRFQCGSVPLQLCPMWQTCPLT